MYSISLSLNEIDTLNWLSARGYFPEEFVKGINCSVDSDELEGFPDRQVTYNMPEHVAWSLTMAQEEDCHAFLTCLDPRSDLYSKIITLMDKIV